MLKYNEARNGQTYNCEGSEQFIVVLDTVRIGVIWRLKNLAREINLSCKKSPCSSLLSYTDNNYNDDAFKVNNHK